jgi:hypothetical protein
MARKITVQTRDELERMTRDRLAKSWSVRHIDGGVEFFRTRQHKLAMAYWFGLPYLIYYRLTGGKQKTVTVLCAEPPRVRYSTDGRYWSTDGSQWNEVAASPPPRAESAPTTLDAGDPNARN